MARTIKSKLNGLHSVVNAVYAMAEAGYLNEDLEPTCEHCKINEFMRQRGYMAYQSEDTLDDDLKLVKQIIEDGEF